MQGATTWWTRSPAGVVSARSDRARTIWPRRTSRSSRSTNDLKLTVFCPQNYVTEGPGGSFQMDDVVRPREHAPPSTTPAWIASTREMEPSQGMGIARTARMRRWIGVGLALGGALAAGAFGCSPGDEAAAQVDVADGGRAEDAKTSTDGGEARRDASGGRDDGGGTPGHDCKDPDPAWLFCEDFEAMAGGYDAWRAGWKWTDHIGAGDRGRMTSTTDAHTGGYAVEYPAAAGSGYQGADLIYRTCEGKNEPGCALKSYDELYFRAYLKFAPDHQRVHHFLSISGSQQFWDAYGNAGCRPNGARAMGTTVDFKDGSHDTFFYTYHPEMSCDSGSKCNSYANAQQICSGCAQKGMPCDNGPECCWGNWFAPPTAAPLPLDRWVCVEMMMKANTVGEKDGEMAYWIDDVLILRQENMKFRTTKDLGLNMVSLQHYLETEDAEGHSNRVSFDDVVVSTKRIGCP